MKKMRWIVCLAVMVSFVGCGIHTKLPDNPIVFERGETEEYVYLSVDDRIYVPYCPLDSKYLGECIGYYELPEDAYTDGGKIYVYALKGYSFDEWIIELDAEDGREGMILRERSTTDIPENLQYEWNVIDKP